VSTPTYEAARDALARRLSATSLAHCERVAETAVALAQVYCVSADEARLAGLLHDWDRDRDVGELREAAHDLAMDITDADEAVPYLLHARTGAQGVLSAFPGIDGSIVDAVATHTVGAADISDLGMVVYVADMLEPARGFPGVDDLREVVGTVDLEGLYTRCYQQSLLLIIGSNRPLHPHTVAAWNALVRGGSDE